MSRFEEIKKGFEEAIAYTQGRTERVRVHRYEILPLPEFEAGEIRQIRIDAGMTQALFAACIGVSKKAVESWECGRTRPDGAARRTLGLMKKSPSFVRENGILCCEENENYS